jgi:hypothetical protein
MRQRRFSERQTARALGQGGAKEVRSAAGIGRVTGWTERDAAGSPGQSRRPGWRERTTSPRPARMPAPRGPNRGDCRWREAGSRG